MRISAALKPKSMTANSDARRCVAEGEVEKACWYMYVINDCVELYVPLGDSKICVKTCAAPMTSRR